MTLQNIDTQKKDSELLYDEVNSGRKLLVTWWRRLCRCFTGNHPSLQLELQSCAVWNEVCFNNSYMPLTNMIKPQFYSAVIDFVNGLLAPAFAAIMKCRVIICMSFLWNTDTSLSLVTDLLQVYKMITFPPLGFQNRILGNDIFWQYLW